WKKLPADVQKGLREAMAEATKYGNDLANSINEADKKKIVADNKAKIVKLNKEQLAAWQKAMAPVWKKFEPGIGADLIKAAQAANK
ncbi:MAG: C4-dicarboxylate ABC transporter, partial [Burkholderiaceae bacterium]